MVITKRIAIHGKSYRNTITSMNSSSDRIFDGTF